MQEGVLVAGILRINSAFRTLWGEANVGSDYTTGVQDCRRVDAMTTADLMGEPPTRQ